MLMIRIAFVFPLVLLLTSSAAASMQPGPAPSNVTRSELAACFAAEAKLAPFSGGVLAQRENENFFRAAGYADAARKVRIRRDHRFRLASVMKALTAAAAGRLIDEGRMSFEAPVGTYVKGLPPEFAAITIEQLVQFRSGIASLTMPFPQ